MFILKNPEIVALHGSPVFKLGIKTASRVL